MNWNLTLTEQQFRAIACSDDPEAEHLIYSFGGISRFKDSSVILIRDQRILAPNEYLHRSAGRIEVSDEITWEVFSTAGRGYQAMVTSHSHLCDAFFSWTDDEYDQNVWRRVHHFCPVYVRSVAGGDGIVAEVITRDDPHWAPVHKIRVVGASGIKRIVPLNAGPCPEPEIDVLLHDRTLRLGKGAGVALETIRPMTLLFIAAGGGNSVVVQLVKHLQPKKVILVDPDPIDRHSGNRSLGYHDDDAGKPKIEVLARDIRAYSPDIEVECHPSYFPEGHSFNCAKEADAFFSFPDNETVRYEAAILAARYHKPLFDAGTLVTFGDREDPQRVTARILTQLPGGPCLHCLGVKGGYATEIEEHVRHSQASYSDRPDLAPDPQVITTNTFAATLLVRNFLAWCYPGLVPRIPTYLQFEELAPSIRDLSALFPRKPDCPICGDGFEAHRGWGDNTPVEKLFEQPLIDEAAEELISDLGVHEAGMV